MTLFTLLISFFELHPDVAYFILFLGSFLETLIGVGFLIYGEIFFLAGAILAGLGYLNIWIVALVCISGGWLGDNSSYFIGRKYGSIIIKKFFKINNKYLSLENFNRSKKFFDTHGRKAVFLARFMGPISWITPFIAGTLGLKYKDFVKYNTPGVIGGIGLFLIAGYVFGFSYSIFLGKALKDIFYIFLILFVIAIYFFLFKLKSIKK